MKRITLAAAALALLASCKSGGKDPVDPGTGGATAPALALSASSLTFTAAAGGASPASQSFTVSNAGGGTLPAPAVEVSYASGAGWISAAAVSGAAAPYTVTVEIAPGALAAGSYQATIAVASSGASNGPLTVAVALTVDAPAPVPLLELGSTGLTFQVEEGGAAPAAQTFTASNAGDGVLAAPSAEVSYQSGAGWISAATVSGSAAPYQVRVEVSPAGLAAGTYQATLAVSSAGAGNGPLVLPVVLVVSHTASMSLSPASLAFQVRVGAADPAPKTALVSAFGSGTLPSPAATVAYLSGDGWLQLAIAGDAPPYTISAQPRIAGLVAGEYRATVSLGSAGAPNAPVALAVRLVVNEPLTTGPNLPEVTFAGPAGGAAPPAQTVSAITSQGGFLTPTSATVDYAAGASGWLTAAISGYQLTLTASTTGLAVGTYQASVSVTATTAPVPMSLPVKLVVTDPAGPAMAVAPATIGFQLDQAASPAVKTVSVSQSGAGTLPAPTVGIEYPYHAGWLSASVSGGAAPYTITLQANPAGLRPGPYWANLRVIASPSSNSPLVVPVTLVVTRRMQVKAFCTSWFHQGPATTAACPGLTVETHTGASSTGYSVGPVTWSAPGEGWADVPALDAPLYLRDAAGYRTSFQSFAASIDLGRDLGGWLDPPRAWVSTVGTWQLSGLLPWQAGTDSLQLGSWDAAFGLNRIGLPVGGTSASVAVDWNGNNGLGLNLLQASDDASALQLRSQATPAGGASYQRGVAAWSGTGFAMSAGAPAAIALPSLPAPVQGSTLPSAWRHSQFQAGLPLPEGSLPAVHNLSVLAVPVPLEAPSAFRQGEPVPLLDLKVTGAALADADYGTLDYQRFFAGHRHYRFAGYVVPVDRAVAGAAPASFLDYVARYDDADQVSGPIVPIVTGVTNLTATRTGTTLWVNWGAPALGAPTSYRVTLYNLYTVSGQTYAAPWEDRILFGLSGSYFPVSATGTYVVGVLALQSRGNGSSAPWREGVPLGASMVYSALIAP